MPISMFPFLRALSLALVLGTGVAAFAARSAEPVASTQPVPLASFQAGTFLENLDVAPNGDVFFTSYFEKVIYRWQAQGGSRVFARLSVHPVSVRVWGNGLLVASHGTSFTDGPAFTSTNQFVWIDAAGQVIRTLPAPAARFLNGMARQDENHVLVADSLAGIVWRLAVEAGDLTEWARDEVMTIDPAHKQAPLGVNGIQLTGRRLLVSNSSRGAIFGATLGPDGRPGAFSPLARPGSVDDFVVLQDGTLVIASYGDVLWRVAPDGTISRFLNAGCGACTAVALWPSTAQPTHLLVTTTGHLLEGRREPAHLLRLPLPRP